MKILIRTVSIILGVIVAGLAFIYFSPGYNLYFVRSESMTPAIKMGDAVITGPLGGWLSKIQVGKVVTIEVDKYTVTHRIWKIDGDTIVTKGDANEDPDPNPITAANIKGVMLFKIPFIGFLAGFIRTKLGWFLTILIPSAVLAGFLIKDILKEAFKGNKKPINKKEAGIIEK